MPKLAADSQEKRVRKKKAPSPLQKLSDKIEKNIIAQIPDSIILVDSKNTIQYYNHFNTIPVKSNKSVVGFHIDRVLMPNHYTQIHAALSDVFQTGNNAQFTIYGDDKTDLYIRIIPIFQNNKNTNTALVIFSHIHPPQAISISDHHTPTSNQQELKKVEAIGALSGGIAHEFNNLLWIIEGNLDLIRHLLPADNSNITYHMEKIDDACQRAKDFTRQIIAFKQQAENISESLKLTVVVREFIKMMRATIPSNIDIEDHYPVENDIVSVDLTQINLMLMTLFTNIAQLLRQNGGRVDISLVNIEIDTAEARRNDCRPGRYVAIIVNATASEKKIDSSDINFSSIADIILQHEGRFKINQQSERSIQADIFIPCIENQPDVIMPDITASIPTGNEKILFIDDEPAIVDAAQRLLKRLGYKVEAASSSFNALKLFKENPNTFDLVITDMTMPDLSGLDVFNIIQQIRPDLPVVLCTGFSDQISPDEAIKLGFKDYLLKPVDKTNLAGVIRRLLDGE